MTLPATHTSSTVLADTRAVADFMVAFDQDVRTTPTAAISTEERLLRARLVLEEALEFVDAMGCAVLARDDGSVHVVDDDRHIDLVEALDALADIIVVTKGSAHTLGVPVDEAFDIVHATNMAKADPVTGKPVKNEYGKVIKPAGWQPPTESLRALLLARGADL